jgi:CRISPR-associated endonuclease/helicase Cas3
MSPDKTTQRDNNVDVGILKQTFDDYMRRMTRDAENTSVNELRANILRDCRVAAENLQGVYTLTVPTGGGKTLSAMAFALDHAVKHNLKRIIIVIPYTSIIEQTAEQYRKIFGDIIVEHHSNLDPERETAKSRLSTENWDASIIVTTNVQLLESLFAAKTSRCRKLHNIVNSVIVIDEAQLLPPNFFQPILDAFQLLVSHYGVTLVLSTATQPALASRKDAFGKVRLRGIDNAREIISDVPALYRALNRIKVEKPIDMSARVSWEQLAVELKQYQSVLVIVNTRKDCRALFDLMPKGTIHLSALMCGEHRSRVIADIKRNLKEGKLVRVVSTQLVEAGVDVDFPVVYRALAGLDSIAQAAGRCNREGKLKNDQGDFVKGRVVVFVPPNAPPKGMLTFGEQATKSVWYGEQNELLSNDLYTKYFQQYFSSVDNDEKNINQLLTKDAGDLVIQFRSAADKFRLIDDKNTVSILVPYDDKAIKLIDALRYGNVSKVIFRKLQRYCVTIYEHDFLKLKKIKAVEQLQLDVWSVCATNMYSDEYGLLLADDLYSIDAII